LCYLHHRLPRSFGDAKKAKVKKSPRAMRVRRIGAGDCCSLIAIHKFDFALQSGKAGRHYQQNEVILSRSLNFD
jgi:hypothetical protein